MNTYSAFIMGELNRNREMMVFDWNKAAKIIKERQAKYASAGLQNDYEYTMGVIWRDGAVVTDDYTFLASTWATPMLIVDGEEVPCYKMESDVPGWGSGTKWPDSALEILNT